jgi:hypothetical protein
LKGWIMRRSRTVRYAMLVSAALPGCIAAAPAFAQNPLAGLLNEAKREAQRTVEAARRKALPSGPGAQPDAAAPATPPNGTSAPPGGTAAGNPELATLGSPTMVKEDGQWITVPGPAPERRPSCVQFRVFTNRVESNDHTVRLEARNNCAQTMEVLPMYHVRFLPNPKRNPSAAIDHFPGGRRFVEPGRTAEMVPGGAQLGYGELRRFWVSAQAFNETVHYRRRGPAPCYHVNWRSGVIGDCGPGFAVPLPGGASASAASAGAEASAGAQAVAPGGRVTWRHIPLPKGESGLIGSECDPAFISEPACKQAPTDTAIFNDMIGPFIDLTRWGVHGIHLGATGSLTQPPRKVASDGSWSVTSEFTFLGKRPPMIKRVSFEQQPMKARAFDWEEAIAQLVKRYGQPVYRWDAENKVHPLESWTDLVFAADPRFPRGGFSSPTMEKLKQRCVDEIMFRTKTVRPGALGTAGAVWLGWRDSNAYVIREECPSILDEFLQIQEASLEPRMQARIKRNGHISLNFTYDRPQAAYEMGKKQLYAARRAAQAPGRIKLDP